MVAGTTLRDVSCVVEPCHLENFVALLAMCREKSLVHLAVSAVLLSARWLEMNSGYGVPGQLGSSPPVSMVQLSNKLRGIILVAVLVFAVTLQG